MEQVYQSAAKKDSTNRTAFLTENGQARLPMVELIEQAQMAMEDFIGLPPKLRSCLATINIIDSPTAGVRLRARRVTNWRNGAMVSRWAAVAYLETEKSFRRIVGYRDLWALQAVLDEDQERGSLYRSLMPGREFC
ncbi:MAG: hypothetical protein HPY44_21695 [Armatimonadetes bacterium]|nr:hypothetical protein [Armatimonadota bacterium]